MSERKKDDSPVKNRKVFQKNAVRKSRGVTLPLGLAALAAVLTACGPVAGGAAAGTLEAASAPAPTEPSGSGVCDNPLYPARVGASWNYHVTGAPTGDFDFSSTIKTVNADGFEEEGVFPGLTRKATWKCIPAGLALLSPGGVTGSVSTSSLSIDFTTTDYSGVTLPKTVNAGDQWTQTLTLHGESALADGTSIVANGTLSSTFTAAGMESVTVPAGTFTAMRIDVVTVFTIESTVSGTTVPVTLNITGSAWYAPGIGMVKTVSTTEGIASTIALTAYTIP